MNKILKNILPASILIVLLILVFGVLAIPLYAQETLNTEADSEIKSETMNDDIVMEESMDDEMVMGPGGQMLVDFGPGFGGQMLHVYVDVLAFLVTLFLVMKLGMGKMRYPIMVLALTLLLTALIPVIWGHQWMWLIALLRSIGIIIAMIWLMVIFGVFQRSNTPSA